jgi:hypothetical protein
MVGHVLVLDGGSAVHWTWRNGRSADLLVKATKQASAWQRTVWRHARKQRSGRLPAGRTVCRGNVDGTGHHCIAIVLRLCALASAHANLDLRPALTSKSNDV